MDVESSICLSDLVPALRWSRPQQVAEILADPRLPAGWWSSLALSRALGATGLDWVCERLARLASARWDHLSLADVLPALTVHHVDPTLPGWPEPTRSAINGLGGWHRLRRLCPGDLAAPGTPRDAVIGSVFREILAQIPIQTGPLPVQPGALPVQPGALPTQTGPLPVQTGARPTQTGPLPVQTGPFPTQTGPQTAPGAPSRPGVSQPGAAPSQPSSAPSQPSALPSRPGAPAQPGTVPAHPGAPAQPGATPAHTGSMPAQPQPGAAQPGAAQPGGAQPGSAQPGGAPSHPSAVPGAPSRAGAPAQAASSAPTAPAPADGPTRPVGSTQTPGAPSVPGAPGGNVPGRAPAAPGQAPPGQNVAGQSGPGAPGSPGALPQRTPAPLPSPTPEPSDTDHAMVRVVDGLFRGMDRLELAVATHRLFAEDPVSLRTLAHKMLVERDVLSQAQRMAEERVLHWLRSSESAPVTGHMFRLTEWLGAAATQEQLIGADPAHPVIVPSLRSPLWRVLVTLMPDRRLQDGWLVVGDLHGLQNRTRQLLATAPNDADRHELLEQLGIRRHSAQAWLDALPPESPRRPAAPAAEPASQQPLPRRTPGANGHHHRGGTPIPAAPAGNIDPSAALATLSALSGGRSPMLAGTPSTPPPPPPSPTSDPRRWQRIEVTPEHLRGGPVPVPEGYAAQLGMRPGTLLSVTGPGDNAIVLVWQGHQPVFDSLQPVLMRLNARPGDQVYVTVDGYRLEAQLTG
ncbi:hypothetical protein [Nonomuraea endophytica]|uniref:Uncharacterized protein n=1 Tax=Nonomuraea endophytica TaxID=714136 RepID=A0A7W8A4G7_9ACTN|nr:hypothetical protein [Nonomuraea endophytica]MBB5078123.1 hypothetical protein [Nonomuraea endophytica]